MSKEEKPVITQEEKADIIKKLKEKIKTRETVKK